MARNRAANLRREIEADCRNAGRPSHNPTSFTFTQDEFAEQWYTDTPTFRNIQTACGIDRDNRPMAECWGPEQNRAAHLSESWHRNESEQGFPVRHRPQLRLEDYSIRDLFEQLVRNKSNGEPVGREFVDMFFNPGDERGMARLRESGAMDAVDYSLFYGITGQLMITAILQSNIHESFVITNLCGIYNTRMLDGERIPGVGMPFDPDKGRAGIRDITLYKPKELLKYIGLSEEYIELPATEMYWLGIALTREILYGDKTGLVLKHCGDLGWLLGLQKEKALIGALIGSNSQPTLYREKRYGMKAPVNVDPYQYDTNTGSTNAASPNNSTAYQTYGTSNNNQFAYAAGTLGLTKGPFEAYANDIAANGLFDWHAFQVADKAFSLVKDPNTGEPIEIGRPMVVLPYTRKWDLLQITQALNIFKLTQSGGAATFGAGNTLTQTDASALRGLFAESFVTSKQLRIQLQEQLGLTAAQADEVWFNGDFSAALKQSVNWPLTVVQAPPQSEAEFSQDIPIRFKASERYAPGWWEPRLVQRHNLQSQVASAYSGQ